MCLSYFKYETFQYFFPIKLVKKIIIMTLKCTKNNKRKSQRIASA